MKNIIKKNQPQEMIAEIKHTQEEIKNIQENSTTKKEKMIKQY